MIWTRIQLSSGASIKTNSAAQDREGSVFFSVERSDEGVLWVHFESLNTIGSTKATLLRLGEATSEGRVLDVYFGEEYFVGVGSAELRIARDGSYARLATSEGETLDGGMAYFAAEEITSNPKTVLGSLFGRMAKAIQE